MVLPSSGVFPPPVGTMVLVLVLVPYPYQPGSGEEVLPVTPPWWSIWFSQADGFFSDGFICLLACLLCRCRK